jgi:hypothetical protein
VKSVILILCTLALAACGGGVGSNSVTTPVVTNATVNPKILSQNLLPATTDLVDYPTPGGYDYSSTSFAFGKFGSTSGNCFLTQSITRQGSLSSTAIPDAPMYVFCQQSDNSFKEVSQQYFGQTLFVNGGYPLIADFNGDGIDDIFVLRGWDGAFPTTTGYAYISQVNGTYHTSQFNVTNPYNFSLMEENIAIDLNGDGCLDVANAMGTYFLGDCAGGFASGSIKNNSTDPYQWGTGICAGDFNATGKKQLVIVDGHTSIFPNQPNAIFEFDNTVTLTAAHPLPVPYWNTVYNSTGATHNFSCRVADINNDGKPDILIFTRPSSLYTNNIWTSQSYVQVYLNQGNWQFQDISATALPGYNTNTSGSYSSRLIDVNGDGYLDIALEGTSFSGVSASGNQIWINNKDSTFTKVFTTELATLDALIPNGAHGVNSMLPMKVNNAWNYIVGEQDASSHYHILLANTQFIFK